MAVTQYIGSRYVPLFADPVEWSSENTYEPLTIVLHEGNSYTSKQAVPKGIDITNEEFWALTGNYNAQIELYRRDTARALQTAQGAQGDIDTLLPKADFSAENTVKEYIDKRSLSFSNVASMIESDNLQEGSYYYTEGFYNPGDGGAASYVMRSNATPNDMDIIACNNGLFAVLVSDKGNPACYGADTSGEKESSAQINYCIEQNHNGLVTFPNGTYKLAESIQLDYIQDASTCIDFGNSNLLSTAQDYAIGLGTKNFDPDVPSGGSFEKDRRICFIGNFHLVSDATYAIVIERNFLNAHIEHFEIECTKNGLCVGVVHEGYQARPTDAYIHDFCITNKDMRQEYTGITINNTDNKVSDGRIYGFKIGMYGVINFVDQVHFLATNLPTDGSFKMTNDWCCIKCNTYAPIITRCYCDSYPCFFKPTSRCDVFTVDKLYAYSYNKDFMSEASIFDLTDLASVTAPRINITDTDFINGSYPSFAKFIELPYIPNMADASATFLKDAVLQGNKVTNLVVNPSLATEIWRKQVGIPFRNRWYASNTAPIGSWVKQGTIIAARSEDLIIEMQSFNSTYGLRVKVEKNNGQLSIGTTENLTAAPYSSNLEYKLGTNKDGYIDVYFRVRNAVTPSYFAVTKFLSTYAIMVPAYKQDAPQAMPVYTTEQIASEYETVIDVNISD